VLRHRASLVGFNICTVIVKIHQVKPRWLIRRPATEYRSPRPIFREPSISRPRRVEISNGRRGMLHSLRILDTERESGEHYEPVDAGASTTYVGSHRGSRQVRLEVTV
jgi:hypothetical protein